MLAPDQEAAARAAFELHRRRRMARIREKAQAAGVLAKWPGLGDDRLERRQDGIYADPNVRVEFLNWCDAWAAAVASMLATGVR